MHAHDDKFPQKTDDVVWLREIARYGWIALTKDKSITRNEREIGEHMLAGGRAFTPAGKMHPYDFADLVILTRNRLFQFIHRQQRRNPGPYFAKIRRNVKDKDKPGTVETWIDERRWRRRFSR